MRWIRHAGGPLLAVVLGLCTHAVQKQIAGTTADNGDQAAPILLLPSGSLLRTLSLGQATSIADLYWLKLVQYVGTEGAARERLPQLLELAHLVTDLDPEYGYAYEAPGIVLASYDRYDESDEILLKGMKFVPNRWRLPFYAAFNDWYGRGDLHGGAELLLQAARAPSRPEYVARLAAQLFSSANEIETGIVMMEAMLAQALPDKVRADFEKRLTELLVERDLRSLERSVALYEEQYGERPMSLMMLPGVDRIPTAPDGSSYAYDAASGEVSSRLLPERLQYYNPDEVPGTTTLAW